jgi:hypothetical protein
VAEIALEAVVDFPVLAVAEASQARIAVAEYFLLILAWIVEVVDLAREVADLEATEDRLVATEAASVATEEATAITEDPLVVEAAVEDLAEDSEEVSGIIEDIFNAS